MQERGVRGCKGRAKRRTGIRDRQASVGEG